jgi:hypothetical protein
MARLRANPNDAETRVSSATAKSKAGSKRAVAAPARVLVDGKVLSGRG